jgi:hypothetical protein
LANEIRKTEHAQTASLNDRLALNPDHQPLRGFVVTFLGRRIREARLKPGGRR